MRAGRPSARPHIAGAGQGQIRLATFERTHDLRVAYRFQMHADIRITFLERCDRRGQDETRLSMRRRDRQFAGFFATQISRDGTDIGRFRSDDARTL